MGSLKLGIQLQTRCAAWTTIQAAAQRIDTLGYDYLFVPDHLMAQADDERATHFESIASAAALAATTTRVRLGLLVGANTFRNPALYAKSIATIDHISAGRTVLGIGSGYYPREHEATGTELGASRQERIGWLSEALSIIRPLLHGHSVTHHGEHYRINQLTLSPRPIQKELPILVGGSGERLTLPAVAHDADMWNMEANLETAARKINVLKYHCDTIGRDPAEIECSVLAEKPLVRATNREAVHEFNTHRSAARPGVPRGEHPPWVGTPDQIAEAIHRFTAAGFSTLIFMMDPAQDEETLARLIHEVTPVADQLT